jgi:hypothetical protein
VIAKGLHEVAKAVLANYLGTGGQHGGQDGLAGDDLPLEMAKKFIKAIVSVAI